MKYVITIIIVLGVLFGIQLVINKTNDTTPIAGIQEVATSTQLTDSQPSTHNNSPQINNTMDTQELKRVDVVVGTGAVAVAGKNVTVHYTGTFTDGKVFDSSVTRGEPFTFALGAGQVIKGWDEGVAGMKVGGKRKLVIPPQLGYGMQDYHSIPGGSILLFDVELLKVE